RAVLIPVAQVPGRVNELSTADEIVVYCKTGVRSGRITNFLRDLGFRKVKNLVGGIDEWAEKVEPEMPRYRGVTAKNYRPLPPSLAGAPRSRHGPSVRDARTCREVVCEDRPVRRVAEARRGTARDRPGRCRPLEVEGPARGRPGQASGAGPEDFRRDRDPSTP